MAFPDYTPTVSAFIRNGAERFGPKPLISLGSGSEARSRSAEELLKGKPRPAIEFGKKKKPANGQPEPEDG